MFIYFYQNVDRLLLAEPSPWHGGRSREALLQGALARLPEDVSGTWGERNQLVMSDLLFGGKLPRFFGFDRGPIPVPEGRATPHQGQICESAGRTTSFAPSIRLLADLGEPTLRTCLMGGPGTGASPATTPPMWPTGALAATRSSRPSAARPPSRAPTDPAPPRRLSNPGGATAGTITTPAPGCAIPATGVTGRYRWHGGGGLQPTRITHGATTGLSLA